MLVHNPACKVILLFDQSLSCCTTLAGNKHYTTSWSIYLIIILLPWHDLFDGLELKKSCLQHSGTKYRQIIWAKKGAQHCFSDAEPSHTAKWQMQNQPFRFARLCKIKIKFSQLEMFFEIFSQFFCSRLLAICCCIIIAALPDESHSPKTLKFSFVPSTKLHCQPFI